MSAYGGGFIYLFQHYFSSDSMLIKKQNKKKTLDSRQHCTKRKKELHSELKHTLWQTRAVVHPRFKYIWKYLINKFLETYKKQKSSSGICKDHLTENKHAVSYDVHYNEKTNKTTHQIVLSEQNAAHTRSLKQAYVILLLRQQRRAYKDKLAQRKSWSCDLQKKNKTNNKGCLVLHDLCAIR